MRTFVRALLGISAAALLCPACGSKDTFTADAGGNYTVALTNGQNGCSFESWEVGKSTSGVGFDITQDGKTLSGTLDSVSALVLGLVIGSADFKGSIDGSDFSLVAYGTIPRHDGNCTYTLNATLKGSISGDSISGTITYAPATSSNPDCASVQCSSVQNFSGSRPP